MTRDSKKVALAAAGLVALLAGCASTVGFDAEIATSPTARIEGPFVPEGRLIDVVLQQTIASELSPPGQRFTARVQAPVHSPDGRVLIREGAVLRGHVVDVDRWRRPSVKLSFDTIETIHGPVEIEATMMSMGAFHVSASPTLYERGRHGYDVALAPRDRPQPFDRSSSGVGYYGPPRPEILLPAGSEMRLVLRHPLLAPGARVRVR
jgi:hypothetical protein